jgi:hypothetical protein
MEIWANIEMQGHQFADSQSARDDVQKSSLRDAQEKKIYDCVNGSAFYTKSINID